MLHQRHRASSAIEGFNATLRPYPRICRASITVAYRELMLPTGLTKRLTNHAWPQNVTEGCASDWTMEQLRESAQRTADCIDELMSGRSPISKDGD